MEVISVDWVIAIDCNVVFYITIKYFERVGPVRIWKPREMSWSRLIGCKSIAVGGSGAPDRLVMTGAGSSCDGRHVNHLIIVLNQVKSNVRVSPWVHCDRVSR